MRINPVKLLLSRYRIRAMHQRKNVRNRGNLYAYAQWLYIFLVDLIFVDMALANLFTMSAKIFLTPNYWTKLRENVLFERSVHCALMCAKRRSYVNLRGHNNA